MSNGAVVAGGLVFLAVAATSVVMFGNVGATTNNLPVRYPLLWIKSFLFHSFTYFSLVTYIQVASVFSALSSMSIDA